MNALAHEKPYIPLACLSFPDLHIYLNLLCLSIVLRPTEAGAAFWGQGPHRRGVALSGQRNPLDNGQTEQTQPEGGSECLQI